MFLSLQVLRCVFDTWAKCLERTWVTQDWFQPYSWSVKRGSRLYKHFTKCQKSEEKTTFLFYKRGNCFTPFSLLSCRQARTWDALEKILIHQWLWLKMTSTEEVCDLRINSVKTWPWNLKHSPKQNHCVFLMQNEKTCIIIYNKVM